MNEPSVQKQEGPRSRRRLGWAGWACLGATVAGLAALLGWLRMRGTESGPRVVGTLTETRAAVLVRSDGTTLLAAAGKPLHDGDTLVVPGDSTAVVALEGQGRAELGPQTTVTFGSDEEGASKNPALSLVLKSGFLALQAGSRPAGSMLHVQTPEGEVEVEAGKLTLGVAGRRTSLRVEEGQVVLRRRAEAEGVTVPAGFRSRLVEGALLPPAPVRSGSVLVIAAPESTSVGGESFLKVPLGPVVVERVRGLAYRVEEINHTELQASDLDGRALVIVPPAEGSAGLENNLRHAGLERAAVPVLCLEPLVYPALGLTGGKEDTDFGRGKASAPVVFPLPEHPLSARLKGKRDGLFSHPEGAGWGRPAKEGLRIVAQADNPVRAVELAYEAEGVMARGRAPARRVGLYLDPAAAREPAAAGWDLFTAAVDWCAEDLTTEDTERRSHHRGH